MAFTITNGDGMTLGNLVSAYLGLLAHHLATLIFALVELHSFQHLRLAFLPWALASVLLVEAYKGLIVSELTAPGPGHNTIKIFNQTGGFIFQTRAEFTNKLDPGTVEQNGKTI